MYIDCRKFDYGELSHPDSDRLVQRDKEFAKEAYSKWIKTALDEIIERQWEVEDVGVVEQSGAFVKLLKEAEFTYSIGTFTSTISLIGVCAEDLCRFFCDFSGHPELIAGDQFSRINRLTSIGAISQSIADKFHEIRQLRNDCLHYNEGFKQKNESELQADALNALNLIKKIYGSILGVIDYSTVDVSKFTEIISRVAEEAHSLGPGNLGFDEVVMKTRNIFAKAFGIDISMNGDGKPEIRTSIFTVREIDDEQPMELTLEDLVSKMFVVVDLNQEDLENINNQNLQIESRVALSLMSVPNSLGITASWKIIGEINKII